MTDALNPAPGGDIVAGGDDDAGLLVRDVEARHGTRYRVRISWPPGQRPPAGGWPILYMLDGNGFSLATELVRYHSADAASGVYSPGIVVSIDYPGESQRVYDYTPALAANRAAAAGRHGGADALGAFLQHELRPWVRAHFAVDAGRQTFFGHSLGGLFVLNTLFQQPEAFQTYVASSPSVWWGNAYLLQAAQQFVASSSSRALSARVLISVGEHEQCLSPRELRAGGAHLDKAASDRETRLMVDRNRALAEMLATLPAMKVAFRLFPDATHRSVMPAALMQGVTAAFAVPGD